MSFVKENNNMLDDSVLFQDFVNAAYRYLEAGDTRVQLDRMIEFVVGLHHSYVDNDKPVSSVDVMERVVDVVVRRMP